LIRWLHGGQRQRVRQAHLELQFPDKETEMAVAHAKSGDVVAIGIPGVAVDMLSSETLIRDTHMEVFRLVLQPGTRMQEHRAAGSLIIQCLHGEITLTAHGAPRQLGPGDLVHLRNGEVHGVAADQLTVLLLTLVLNRP
jgi:quercetin dioxygenase-like cupin family protein